ncbi:hypothetical protein T08_13049 [Trichinella sp. T8]|uniref:Uncharacterized protein n=1 Tax=Trichinella murrelli TaxID=144512 RepID=A0A0V0TXG4_9BILA|nr:hypothetical protein T05_5863 [Trichinella murrelli]KRZ92630.1 hypothetical protein T08_13049 [Trichinella sp. T8]
MLFLSLGGFITVRTVLITERQVTTLQAEKNSMANDLRIPTIEEFLRIHQNCTDHEIVEYTRERWSTKYANYNFSVL